MTMTPGKPSIFLPRPIGLGDITEGYPASVLQTSAQILSLFGLQVPASRHARYDRLIFQGRYTMIASTILSNYWENGKEVKIDTDTYQTLLKNKERDAIAKMIYYRFFNRYIHPFKYNHQDYKKYYKNGFAMMASACLMIEALESFYNGWGSTQQTGDNTFKSFFGKFKSLKVFQSFNFYKFIRCGLLHQAETTGGYKISRIGQLFNKSSKTINAVKFHDELEKCLTAYCDLLKTKKWDSGIWDNFRVKMRSIIKNCKG